MISYRQATMILSIASGVATGRAAAMHAAAAVDAAVAAATAIAAVGSWFYVLPVLAVMSTTTSLLLLFPATLMNMMIRGGSYNTLILFFASCHSAMSMIFVIKIAKIAFN